MKQRTLKILKGFAIFGLAVFMLFGMALNHADARGKTSTKAQCRFMLYCHYVIEKDGLTYDVIGNATYKKACDNKPCPTCFPSYGCPLILMDVAPKVRPDILSQKWTLACGNVHGYDATIIGGNNGVCGTASTQRYSSTPTKDLCQTGAASVINATPTSYDWTCSGIYGGQTTACSAQRTSTFNLSCNANPVSGTVNQPVTFTAGITGTSTPVNGFTYTWTVDGVDVSDDNTLVKTFTNATNTASVKVKAERGIESSVVDCNFNRVSCAAPNPYYCGDSTTPTSYACSTGPGQCPTSMCGPGYDIATDKQLDEGGQLQRTPPSASYIQSNALCQVGSLLKVNSSGISTWRFTPSYSMWQWECKNPQALESASCQARCKTGEYFCGSKGYCVPESESCDCNLQPNNAVVDQRQYCLDPSGTCYACGLVISYFTLRPSEVPRDGSAQCGAYWNTVDIPIDQQPVGTSETRVVCEMKSGAASAVSCPATNTIGSSAYGLPIGTHSLTCTQQYRIGTNPTWNNLASNTQEQKCRPLPAIREN